MDRTLLRAKTKAELMQKMQEFLGTDLITLEPFKGKIYLVYTRYGFLHGYKVYDTKRRGWRFAQCETKPIKLNPTW